MDNNKSKEQLIKENALLKQEITKLRKSEDNLGKYQFIANAAADFMSLINRDYEYVAVNDSYCKERGLSQDGIIGKSLKDIWGEESFISTIKPFLDKCFNGEVIHYQDWFNFTTIEDGFYDVVYYPYYQNDEVTHIAVVTRNITTLKKTEIALRESQQKYQGIVESSFDAIFRIRPDGTFTYMSKACERICQFTPTEILGVNLDDLFNDSEKNKVSNTLFKLTRGEKVEACELFMMKKDGGLATVEINAIPISDDHFVFYQGIIRDLTERKKIEKRQKELEEELQNEHRLSSIGLLASGIAHNIRNPLTVLYGYIYMLEEGTVVNSTTTKALNKSTDKISQIVDTMMTKCRKEQETDPRSINLSELLESELEFLNADLDFKNKIRKNYELDLSIPSIFGVYSDFSQALLNIIRNAADAMYAVKEKTLQIKTYHADDIITVEIRDTGHGISKENVEKLFDPFYTTKPASDEAKGDEPKGTGLGLYSSYNLLKPYNVKFDVESEPGKGTCFYLKFPVRKE